jgi:hypothetical protein
MGELSEWLQLMLAEIARKRDDLERAREEDAQRNTAQRTSSTEKSSDTRVDGAAQRQI